MGRLIVIVFLIIVILLLAGVGGYLYLTRLGSVPHGQVGIVHRKIPGHDPRDRWFSVAVYKSAGPQAQVLRANSYFWRPPLLYTVELIPVVRVQPGTIGVVHALVGDPTPPGAKCVTPECDHFQDAAAFLTGGGQAGRQLDVLTAGTYGINPYVFEVLTVDNIGGGKYGLTVEDLQEISVPVGYTGVVVTLAGDPPEEADGAVGPRVPSHHNFQLASEFVRNGGRRGAQEQTLSGGGVYQINPWFARVARVPTRDLLLEWSAKKKPPGNFDAALDRIAINIEGHRIWFTMSQVIRIPGESAPRLVGRFGEQEADVYGASHASDTAPVQRFVERALGATVEGYFQTVSANYKVLEFFRQYDEVRMELEDRVQAALHDWGVEAVRTTLGEFECEDQELDRLRREIAAERERRTLLESMRSNAIIDQETKKIEADTEAYAQTAPEILLLQRQIELLNADQVAKERFLSYLTQMGVPQVVGGDPAQLLQLMPLHQALGIIAQASGGHPLGPGANGADAQPMAPSGPDDQGPPPGN